MNEELIESIAPLCAKAFNEVSCAEHRKIIEEIIQLVKEACKEKVKDIEIDGRSSGHMINGFLEAKYGAIRAIDEL